VPCQCTHFQLCVVFHTGRSTLLLVDYTFSISSPFIIFIRAASIFHFYFWDLWHLSGPSSNGISFSFFSFLPLKFWLCGMLPSDCESVTFFLLLFFLFFSIFSCNSMSCQSAQCVLNVIHFVGNKLPVKINRSMHLGHLSITARKLQQWASF